MSNIYKSKVISIMAPMNKGNFFHKYKDERAQSHPHPKQNKTTKRKY